MLTVLTLASCSKNDEAINIRLSNVSIYNFENIVVNTSTNSTGIMNYDNLASGQFSEYKEFEIAYRYAYVELTIEGEIYKFQPVDYVGETPLDGGNYTYELNAYPQAQVGYNYLSIELIEE